MQVCLDEIDFAPERTKDGFSSGGELYFTIDDEFFPEEHWYDYAYLDLKLWLPRICSFGSNHTDSCELSFMDGPYSIRLNRREDGSVCVNCLRNSITIISRQNVNLLYLFKSLLSCCRKYDRFLHENQKEPQFREEIILLNKLLDTIYVGEPYV